MSLLPPDPSTDDPLTGDADADVCRPEHCFHAFDALYTALTGADAIEPAFADDKYPLFVTWNKRRRLRGCIGSFDAQPLRAGLAEYALVSAFRDHRFRRVDAAELPALECGVSLLTDFEDAASYLDWTVGVHGIHISFPHPSLLPATGTSASASASNTPSPRSSSSFLPRVSVTAKPAFSATYLPDVMPEQGWDKLEAVDSAIRKAGWSGRITEDIRRSVKLRRYQSRRCVVQWEEYVQWRKEHGGTVDIE